MGNPKEVYEDALRRGEIEPDSAQEMAIGHLQGLYTSYTGKYAEFTRAQANQGWSSWLRRFTQNPFTQDTPASLNGLYFWGGVGRGKTYLMDLFYEQLPEQGKSRYHFHRFMRLIHQQLKSLQGTSDPLDRIAREFSAETQLLCFDEFFVSDITDAMILAGLLKGLFENGVVLVATSNVHPDHLYENGLQRRRFLPAIELIKRYTQVVNVDGGTDYRLRALEDAEIYHSPLDVEADRSLARSFKSLSPDQGEADLVLEIEGRNIASRYCGDGVVWFEFKHLCGGPRSQNDYIEIARLFQTVLISNVPQMHLAEEDLARRFISLVDEFYDRNVKLILSAEVPVELLYKGERLSFEFERTKSRLQEMMSHEYLTREHKP